MRYFSKAEPEPTLRSQLQQQLNETRRELALSYAQFNFASEPELVEACVYQISAIQARCNYLIRAIKARCAAKVSANVGEEVSWT